MEEDLGEDSPKFCKLEELWIYYPGFFPEKLFEPLLEQLRDKAVVYDKTYYGKTYPSKRESCLLTDLDKFKKDPRDPLNTSIFKRNYKMPYVDLSEVPLVLEIKKQIEVYLNSSYDYCLCHVYRTGDDTISYHSDKEAYGADVVSVSFGQKRKFRIKRKNLKKGYDFEYLLGSGDMFHMLPGCQEMYVHCVPHESTIKKARINLTFRRF